MGVIASLAATPALACPDFGHPNLFAGPTLNLGGGMVAQTQARRGHVTGTEKLFAESIYKVQDCAVGSSLWLYREKEQPRGAVIYDKAAEMDVLVRSIPSNSNLQSIPAVKTAAEKVGAETWDIGAVDVETCMCAETYPELRGAKVAYEDVK